MGLRDYGLGSSGTPNGVPQWKKAEPINGLDPLCPNCGAWLCEISLPVLHPSITGGKGICEYLGCPACPFAGPAVTRAVQESEPEPEPFDESWDA